MLGDGCLLKSGSRIWFSETHSVAQKGYVEWKRLRWGPWASRLRRRRSRLTIREGGSHLWTREQWAFTTLSSLAFASWEEAFYGWRSGGRRAKRFSETVLDHVSPLMLAVWYMDDGMFVGDYWPGFACHERSHEVGIEVLRRIGIETVPTSDRTALGVRTRDMADRLLSVVEGFVHEDLRYKLDPPCLLNDRRRRVTFDVNEVREMVSDGLTLRQIARRMGWGEKFARIMLGEMGLVPVRGRHLPASTESRDLSGAVRRDVRRGPGRRSLDVSTADLRRLVQEDPHAGRLAARFGISVRRLSTMLDRHGIPRPWRRGTKPGVSVVDPVVLADLVGRGLPRREIARRMSVSTGAVDAACRRDGLTTKGAHLARMSRTAVPTLAAPAPESVAEEVWDEVVGFPGYRVSSLGRVRSFRRTEPRDLRHQRHRDGTVFVVLMTLEGSVPRYVHHVVLEAFRGPRGEGQEARFLNGVRDDCRLRNLVWGSAEDGHPRVHRDRAS